MIKQKTSATLTNNEVLNIIERNDRITVRIDSGDTDVHTTTVLLSSGLCYRLSGEVENNTISYKSEVMDFHEFIVDAIINIDSDEAHSFVDAIQEATSTTRINATLRIDG